MLLQMKLFHSFLCLSSITLCMCVCVCACVRVCVCTTSSLSIHLLMDIYVQVLAIVNSAAVNIGVLVSF